MRKTYLLAAAAAAMFAACSSNESIDAGKQPAPVATTDQGAVTFDAYTQRGTSRAGAAGVIKTEAANSLGLKDANVGFGVFGYYTNNNEYDGQTIPDFFYNQKVYWDATYWKYEPVKYWPNEYGSSAIADDADKVSYFAYAPYVVATPSTGKVSDDASYGIAQLSRNSLTGDPYVKYIASFKWNQSVDLLWGVVPTDNTTWNTVAGAHQTFAAGLPWLDVERPLEAATQTAATQRVKFDFRHALSQLNVVVDYDADQTGHTDDANPLGAATRVYVRNVSFTGFAMKGALNLNNVVANTPLWKAYDGESDLESGGETVINDGRKDGREGNADAPTEKNIFINPALIQTKAWSTDNKGVLNKAQNLFWFPAAEKVATNMLLEPSDPNVGKVNLLAAEQIGLGTGMADANDQDYTTGTLNTAMLNWPVMVIPNGDDLSVTITYDVETVDPNLATKLSDTQTLGSSIENRITKTITLQGGKNYLEAGKKYTINLHLGLNSVKFDAVASDWDTPTINGENWLPYNETVYQASGVYNYTLTAATVNNLGFKLSGFAPGESVTGTFVAPVTALTGSPWSANATTGIVDVAANAATITANTQVVNVTTASAITFTGASSGKTVSLNLVQLAAQPDGTNSTLAISAGDTEGVFALADDAGTTLSGDVWQGSTRNVTIVSAYRNGVEMTEVAESVTPTGALQFSCDQAAGSKKIKLGAPAASGEVFIFTIKAGDSKEVTIKCTVS